MTDSTTSTAAGDRLAKVIARSGLCSRRDAEEWIKQGRVAVNDAVIRTPAFNVTSKDRIKVDGAPLAARSGTRVWLYHKPAGLVVTEKDPEGRPTIFEALDEAGLPRVLTVGRLDLNTEGLLLLTNDGGLKRVLELPSTGWLRRYRVRAFGRVSQAMLDGLKDGIEVDGVKYGPIEAVLEREQGSNVWLVVALREGKNREVKNVLGALGLEVNRLIRVSYGPFQLGDLPAGAVEVVKARVLRDQLGKKLAEEAEVDFESEMPEVAARAGAADPRQRVARPGKAPASGAGERPARPARGPRPPVRDEERPRRDRPGRGDIYPPSKPPRAARPEGPARRILFDDGRPPEEFHPPLERAARGDRPGFAGGKPREAAGQGPRADRPSRGDKPFGHRPREGGPAGERPARAPRAPRADDAPRSRTDRPDRAPRGDRPFVRRPREDGASGERPARPPRAPRADAGPRSYADRPDRAPSGDKPARRPRAEGTGPARPPREGRSDGARPQRGAGARPAGAARPGGKGFGDRDRAKPAGSRPAAARPAGSRPSRPAGPPSRGPRPAGGASGRPPRPAGPRPPRKPRG